jgi:hypothetical protein
MPAEPSNIQILERRFGADWPSIRKPGPTRLLFEAISKISFATATLLTPVSSSSVRSRVKR